MNHRNNYIQLAWKLFKIKQLKNKLDLNKFNFV